MKWAADEKRKKKIEQKILRPPGETINIDSETKTRSKASKQKILHKTNQAKQKSLSYLTHTR